MFHLLNAEMFQKFLSQFAIKIINFPGTFRRANVRLNQTLLKEMPDKLKLEAGGRWFPKHCASWQRVAVIISYRNREEHLQIFLQNMHPYLQSQQLDYGIFVIEQVLVFFSYCQIASLYISLPKTVQYSV